MTTLKKNIKMLEKAAKDVLKDKESARQFLLSSGIMDANGKLAKPYRICF